VAQPEPGTISGVMPLEVTLAEAKAKAEEVTVASVVAGVAWVETRRAGEREAEAWESSPEDVGGRGGESCPVGTTADAPRASKPIHMI